MTRSLVDHALGHHFVVDPNGVLRGEQATTGCVDADVVFVLEAFVVEVEPLGGSGTRERVEINAHGCFFRAVNGGNADGGDGSDLRVGGINVGGVALLLFRDDGHALIVETGAQNVESDAGIAGTVHSFGITQVDLTHAVGGNAVAEGEGARTDAGSERVPGRIELLDEAQAAFIGDDTGHGGVVARIEDLGITHFDHFAAFLLGVNDCLCLVELGVSCGGFDLTVAVVGFKLHRTGGAGDVLLLTVRSGLFTRAGFVGRSGVETVDLRNAGEYFSEEAVGSSGHSAYNFSGRGHAFVSIKLVDGDRSEIVFTGTRRETIHVCDSGDSPFRIFLHIFVIIGSCLLVIALVCPAQEVEIAVNKIGVEERKTLVEVFGTVVEVAVAGIA